jgi:plastocyanin
MATVRMALAAALLFLASGCGSSYSTPTNPTTPSNGGGGSGTPVSIVRGATGLTTTAYNPNPVTVRTGGSVTWTNSDTTTHTSTGSAWDSGPIAPGASYTMTFQTAGTFTYHCTFHPGMVATVTVQ